MERGNYYQPERGIPADAPRFREIEQGALLALYQERYDEAVELYQQAYDLLLGLQRQLERGIHKGTVLYNLGIAVLGRHQRFASRQAFSHILLAYIEDTLGTPFDSEEDADRAPAGRFLIDGFVIQLRFLREIKAISRAIKRNADNWLHAYDPNDVLRQVLRVFRTNYQRILELCQRRDVVLGPAPLLFPQPPEQRVFLGLNYDTSAHLIPEMRLAVIQRGLTPVLMRDVIVPPGGNVHNVSLLLLHTCSSAIFDITHPAGQFMEIERAGDYGIRVLLVRSEPVGHPPNISAMIRALGYPIGTYRDMAHLRQLIIDFLH
jgi:hypothetical protein